MIKELQIRPFARPLLVWIAGAILQTVFSCCTYSWVLLLLPVIILTTAGLALRGQEHFCYETRWLWGAVFLSLLLFLSIQKTAYSQFEASSEHPTSLLSRWAREEQQRLLEPIEKLNLTDEEKSVLATITVGYRQAMSREVRNRFSVTGVAHILAVSGFHVAIVCGFLSFLFSFLSRNGCCRWIRYISLLVLLWGFVAITGLAASSVRAALMLTMYLTGGVLDRRAERYNILAASAFCMLVYEPLYLFDIGFQLSYLAVLSILYFQPRLQALIKVHNPFLRTPWGWVTVTLSAQAGTTFLCLYYFGQFSTVFLLTNLPLTFLATLLIRQVWSTCFCLNGFLGMAGCRLGWNGWRTTCFGLSMLLARYRGRFSPSGSIFLRCWWRMECFCLSCCMVIPDVRVICSSFCFCC